MTYKTRILALTATTLLASSGLGLAQVSCNTRVTYEVEVHTHWPANDPIIPQGDGAFFTPLLALTHGPQAVMFRTGLAASLGMEVLAETGATSVVENEAAIFGIADLLRDMAKGKNLQPQDSFTFTILAEGELSHLSLAAGIAPSPDWFVGLDSLNLCQDGVWLEAHAGDLRTFDAGTNSAQSPGADRLETNPQGPVAYIPGGPALASVQIRLL